MVASYAYTTFIYISIGSCASHIMAEIMLAACGQCSQLVRARQQSVQCSNCTRPFHHTCNTGISQLWYCASVRAGLPIVWECRGCNPLDIDFVPPRQDDVPDEPVIVDAPVIADVSLYVADLGNFDRPNVHAEPDMPDTVPVPRPVIAEPGPIILLHICRSNVYDLVGLVFCLLRFIL